MIDRAGTNGSNGKAQLFIQLTEQRKDLLEHCQGKDHHLAKYYFQQCFEFSDIHDSDTGLRRYIEELTVFEADDYEKASGERELAFIVRAELRITLEEYNGLRAPFNARERGKGRLPEYAKMAS